MNTKLLKWDIYLKSQVILCRTCAKIYVGSTIIYFRKRFNNHKSSMNRYSKEQRGIAGENVILIFLKLAIKELHEDLRVKIIDKTNVYDPTNREGFWAYSWVRLYLMKYSWFLSGLTKHHYAKSYIKIKRRSTEDRCRNYFYGPYEKKMEEVWK